MRALVLGATGHLGAHVVRALLRHGYAVRAAYRNPRYLVVLDELPVERVALDLDEPSQVQQALADCTMVFHCAGPYPRVMERRSIALGRCLRHIRVVFDTFQRTRPQRIVYLSSAATIARRPERLSTEADVESWPPAQWHPLYATCKIAMEHAVLRYAEEGLPIVVINPSFCIGEYDARPFSGRLVLLFARGRLPVYLDYPLNVVYSGDVGEACVRAAEQKSPGTRHVLTQAHVTLKEFADCVANVAGVTPPRYRLPRPAVSALSMLSELMAAVTRSEPLLPRRVDAMDMHRPWLDGSGAMRVLGVTYTPMEDAIRRAVAWFRQHRYLPTT